MSNEELPPAVLAVLKALWESDRKLHISISPKDAWTTVAVIQFASRNPQLSPTQRDQAIAVGRKLQEELELFAPAAARYLEDGWNPAKDVSR
jgi:pantothenate synthetase